MPPEFSDLVLPSESFFSEFIDSGAFNLPLPSTDPNDDIVLSDLSQRLSTTYFTQTDPLSEPQKDLHFSQNSNQESVPPETTYYIPLRLGSENPPSDCSSSWRGGKAKIYPEDPGPQTDSAFISWDEVDWYIKSWSRTKGFAVIIAKTDFDKPASETGRSIVRRAYHCDRHSVCQPKKKADTNDHLQRSRSAHT